VRTCAQMCLNAYMCRYANMRTCVCVYVCICCISVHLYMCVRVNAYMCTCVCVCLCICGWVLYLCVLPASGYMCVSKCCCIGASMHLFTCVFIYTCIPLHLTRSLALVLSPSLHSPRGLFLAFFRSRRRTPSLSCSPSLREVGGWGRVPFSRNLMSPTPRRKWYLTTGRRAH